MKIVEQIKKPIVFEMETFEKKFSSSMTSKVALLNRITHYIVNRKGKQMRPMFVFLVAKMLSKNNEVNERTFRGASVIELIHTATLVHDDVVDDSNMRRGFFSINALWKNKIAVLVGDYLYSRSFQMMVSVGSMRVMEILSRTTNQIAEGEVMQLINCGSAETTEQQYMDTIQSKTAILFEAATQLGAVITKQASPVEDAMAAYGLHLGTAFQLVDDVLDYTADSEAMGKNVGDDLAEGKPTLPLINALQRSDGADKDLLIDAITNASRDNLDDVLAIIEKTGSLAYTSRVAREQAQLAQQSLAVLSDSVYKTALMKLAEFSIERAY